MRIFFYSVQSEWLKTKNSIASWLCLVGGFFIPLLYLIADIKNKTFINSAGTEIWQTHFTRLWMNMSGFLLPMGLILASSLITQVEFKSNSWKQVHVTPQKYSTIFFAKLAVLLGMTLKFFLFFNIGVIIAGTVPCLIFDHSFPKENIPWLYFIEKNARYFIACLPIIALQYLLSLQFKNFVIAVGVGLAGLIGTFIAFRWQYIYLSPFSYTNPFAERSGFSENILLYATIYFVVFTIISFYLYVNKKIKG